MIQCTHVGELDLRLLHVKRCEPNGFGVVVVNLRKIQINSVLTGSTHIVDQCVIIWYGSSSKEM